MSWNKNKPIWFQINPLLRLAWFIGAFIISPLQVQYRFDPQKIHAVIIARDIYSPLINLVKALLEAGIATNKIIILDLGSTVENAIKVINKLEETGCKVIKVSGEALRQGPYIIWLNKELPLPKGFWEYPFLVTDPDLDLSGIPKNWLITLMKILNGQRWISKSALGLRVDDINCDNSLEIVDWENKLSKKPPYSAIRVLKKFIKAPISLKPTDTTIALYRPNSNFSTISIRLESKYKVRHLAWYKDFRESKEFNDYSLRKLPDFGHWSSKRR